MIPDLDLSLFRTINQTWSSPVLDRIMPAVSSLDLWRPLLVAAAIGFLLFGGSRGKHFILAAAIGLLVGDLTISHFLKTAIHRPRPRDVVAGAIVRSLAPGEPKFLQLFKPPVIKVEVPGEDPTKHGNSFPSSHVINLSMLATVAFRFRRRIGLAMGGFVFLTAWSRIYCAAHWSSDIPPSILLGVFAGTIALWISGKIIRAIARRPPFRPRTEEPA